MTLSLLLLLYVMNMFLVVLVLTEIASALQTPLVSLFSLLQAFLLPDTCLLHPDCWIQTRQTSYH
jgi:hypothetical protein